MGSFGKVGLFQPSHVTLQYLGQCVMLLSADQIRCFSSAMSCLYISGKIYACKAAEITGKEKQK